MEKTLSTGQREALLKRAGIIGIAVNAMLAGIKVTIGLVSNSVSIISDGLNNFSDCITSLITLVSAGLAGRLPDRKHPNGYGRVEYIAAFSVSLIIIVTGLNLLRESVARIITPQETSFSLRGILILLMSVAVKIILSRYQIRTGQRCDSDALTGAGREAVMDVVQSSATVICAVILRLTGVNLDAWAGALISVLMIKTGIEIFREAFDALIGTHENTELAQTIEREILAVDGIQDVFHLVLHNYGPLNRIGSACISLDSTLSVEEAAAIAEKARRAVQEAHHIELRFDIHSVNTGDPEALAAKTYCEELAMKIPGTTAVHGFEYAREYREIRMTADVDQRVRNFDHYLDELCGGIRKRYPDVYIKVRIVPR